MKLIAKRPCSFGGRKFYIGDEVPAGLVLDPASQEKLGILSVLKDGEGPAGVFTWEQVDSMIAEAVAAAGQEREARLTELEETCRGVVSISVKGEADGEMAAVPAKTEEIQQVFSIMQTNADEGAKLIADVTSENVLILLHAADSRKTIKNAARERAERLFPAWEEPGQTTAGGGNADSENADAGTEGDVI